MLLNKVMKFVFFNLLMDMQNTNRKPKMKYDKVFMFCLKWKNSSRLEDGQIDSKLILKASPLLLFASNIL